jgi:hypothetical protein
MLPADFDKLYYYIEKFQFVKMSEHFLAPFL